MIILIDNYDSFSYNLYQMLGSISADIRVVRNDDISLPEIRRMADHIILSPGPGRPERAGICEDVVREFAGKIPILGVCLGHQAICEAFGANVDYASDKGFDSVQDYKDSVKSDLEVDKLNEARGKKQDEAIEAVAWLSVALVIFTRWKPINAIWGAYLFGICYWAYNYFPKITGIKVNTDLTMMLPYVVTIVVLIVTSIKQKKDDQAPASLGLSYFREDR